MVYLQTYMANGQKICERQKDVEWHAQPKHHIVKWSLMNKICSHFYTDCWNINANDERNISEHQALNVPQICPLQLQLGDSLFISSEDSFQPHGVYLGNISLEEFIRCPTKGFLQEQLIFHCRSRGMQQVDPQWLGVGTHYFAEVYTKGPLLCNLGLRLNVTVKPQFCQQSSNAPFCSRHGRCLSHVWEEAYKCHCSQQYSGQFCEEFDACSSTPCHNNATCIDIREGPVGDSYECACPSQFAGKKCSEIVGQCQPHLCQSGNCINVTPNTFLCECGKDFTGPFCEIEIDECESNPCKHGGTCVDYIGHFKCTCHMAVPQGNCAWTDLMALIAPVCYHVLKMQSHVQMEVAVSLMKRTRILYVSVLLDGLEKSAWRTLMTVKRTGASMELLVKMESMNTDATVLWDTLAPSVNLI
ncbi:protein eyes shut homolog [Carettochelys insculpta]|uniref:protein eyes shut homolog n=1 Tax=Carettochelys insculpta TaxID=44489 RepID=UPI003EBCE85B